MKGRDSDQKPKGAGPPEQWRYAFVYFIVLMLIVWFWQEAISRVSVRTIPYSQFKEHLAKGDIIEVNVGPDVISGKIRPRACDTGTNQPPAKDAEKEFVFRAVRLEDPKLVEQLQAANVKFTGTRPNLISQFLLAWILPIAIMILIWSLISRRIAGASQSVFGFAKSKARLIAERESGVTFKDVAGCDEAKFELQEVVDFLKSPNSTNRSGRKFRKGFCWLARPARARRCSRARLPAKPRCRSSPSAEVTL